MATVIAIVEDDTDQRENYSDVLTAHGYEVRAYPDRPSAQSAFERDLPDLALLDIEDGKFILRERAPGVSVEDIAALTEGELVIPDNVPEM